MNDTKTYFKTMVPPASVVVISDCCHWSVRRREHFEQKAERLG